MDSGLTDHVETERKYDVGQDFVVPDLNGLAPGLTVTEPVVWLLTASYFDTSEHRLAAARITLRRRTGGGDAGWHLKLPADGGSRRELQLPLGSGDDDAVPPQLASLVEATTQGEPLRVIALLQTRRTVRQIVGPGGADLAEVADDLVTGRGVTGGGVTSGSGAGGGTAAWREIEVELVAGTAEILAAADARLRAAGARPAAASSKLGRLLDAMSGRLPGGGTAS
jgi:inorganic triphosphatase YgiF